MFCIAASAGVVLSGILKKRKSTMVEQGAVVVPVLVGMVLALPLLGIQTTASGDRVSSSVGNSISTG